MFLLDLKMEIYKLLCCLSSLEAQIVEQMETIMENHVSQTEVEDQMLESGLALGVMVTVIAGREISSTQVPTCRFGTIHLE